MPLGSFAPPLLAAAQKSGLLSAAARSCSACVAWLGVAAMALCWVLPPWRCGGCCRHGGTVTAAGVRWLDAKLGGASSHMERLAASPEDEAAAQVQRLWDEEEEEALAPMGSFAPPFLKAAESSALLPAVRCSHHQLSAVACLGRSASAPDSASPHGCQQQACPWKLLADTALRPCCRRPLAGQRPWVEQQSHRAAGRARWGGPGARSAAAAAAGVQGAAPAPPMSGGGGGGGGDGGADACVFLCVTFSGGCRLRCDAAGCVGVHDVADSNVLHVEATQCCIQCSRQHQLHGCTGQPCARCCTVLPCAAMSWDVLQCPCHRDATCG